MLNHEQQRDGDMVALNEFEDAEQRFHYSESPPSSSSSNNKMQQQQRKGFDSHLGRRKRHQAQTLLEAFLSYFCCASHFSRVQKVIPASSLSSTQQARVTTTTNTPENLNSQQQQKSSTPFIEPSTNTTRITSEQPHLTLPTNTPITSSAANMIDFNSSEQLLEQGSSSQHPQHVLSQPSTSSSFLSSLLPFSLTVLEKNDTIRVIQNAAESSSANSKRKSSKNNVRLMTDAIIHEDDGDYNDTDDEDDSNYYNHSHNHFMKNTSLSHDEKESEILHSEYSIWLLFKCMCCASRPVTFLCHPPRCITIMNTLLFLFILQGIFGISAAFILLYSSGQKVVQDTLNSQQLQIRTFSGQEILNLVDYTSLAIDTMRWQMSDSHFDVKNTTHWLTLFHYIVDLYGTSMPIDAVNFARYDNVYIGYSRNTPGYFTLMNGSIELQTQCQYYWRYMPNQRISDMYLRQYFYRVACNPNSTTRVQTRPWYQTYARSEDYWTEFRWAPVFKTVSGDQTIAVTIPVYTINNLTQLPQSEVQGDTSYAFLPENSTNAIRFISPENLNSSQKNPLHLYGVVGFQLQSQTLSRLLKNSSNLFGDLDLAFITNSDGDLIALNANTNDAKYNTAQAIINSYRSRNILKLLNSTSCDLSMDRICSKFIERSTFIDKDTVLDVELTVVNDLYQLSWGVAVATKTATFADEIITGGITSVVVFLIVFIFGMICLFFCVRGISTPLYQISMEMLKLSTLTDLNINALKDGHSKSLFSDIKEMQEYMSSMKKGMNTITKYVPEIVIKKFMMRQQEALLQDLSGFIVPNCATSPYGYGGTTLPVMTILCCEMEGFRTLSETLKPHQLLNLLNNYFTFVSDIIHNHQGVIDTFNNVDGTLMCYFNEPTTMPLHDHELKACATAFEILEGCMEMTHFNKEAANDNVDMTANADQHLLEENEDDTSEKETSLLEQIRENEPECNIPIRVKIGINTGSVLCGNLVHTPNRMSYTVFGKNVEIASKLTTLNHYFNTSILIGPQTYEKVQEAFLCYFIDILPREKIYESYSEDILLNEVMPEHAKSSLAMIETIRNHKNIITTTNTTSSSTTNSTTASPQLPSSSSGRDVMNENTKTHPLYSLSSRLSQRGMVANPIQGRTGAGTEPQQNSSLLAIYELVCHKNKANQLQQRIHSDLKQVESLLKSIVMNKPTTGRVNMESNTMSSGSSNSHSNRGGGGGSDSTNTPSIHMNSHYLQGKCSLLLSLTDMKNVKILHEKCQRFEKDKLLL